MTSNGKPEVDRVGDELLLLVGTKKGAFILERGPKRAGWQLRGPMCEGWPIHDIAVDPTSGTFFAGGASPWYGATVFRSDDRGAAWSQSSEGLTYGDEPKL